MTAFDGPNTQERPTGVSIPSETSAKAWKAAFDTVCAERDRLRADFQALQFALVGNTGLSAILEATRLRNLHPLTKSK